MKKKNFTLLELLFVTALMAILAGGALFAFNDAEEKSSERLRSYSNSQVLEAFVNFKRDMGYYPKVSGVLDFASLENGSLSEEDFNDLSNLSQLFIKPEKNGNSTFWDWDIDSARGWNGPYLRLNGAFNDEGIYRILVDSDNYYEYDPVSLTINYPGLDSPIELPR